MAVNSNVSLSKINCYEHYTDLNIVADVNFTDIYTHIHIHTHSYIYIYIYIYVGL
jgi:hypothetical protein